jgi:hypothetical protein
VAREIFGFAGSFGNEHWRKKLRTGMTALKG